MRDNRDQGIGELCEHFSSGKFAGVTDQVELYEKCTRAEIDTITGEIDRIQSDFRYCARNYFYIISKDGTECTMKLWDSQNLVLDALQAMRDRGKPGKILSIKARQVGLSLLSEALIAWKCFYNSNETAIIASTDRKSAAHVFSYLTGIYKRLPLFLKPEHSTLKIEDGLTLDTPFGEDPVRHVGLNSRISLEWSNKKSGLGRGQRVTAFHATEISDWRSLDEILENEIKHALVKSPETLAILESTPKGAGTQSHALWQRMVELGDDADWYALFIPWFTEKTRVLAPHKGWRPNSDSIAMREVVEDAWVRCSNKLCDRCRERRLKNKDMDGERCTYCGIGILHAVKLTDFQLNFMEMERKNAKDVRGVKQELATTANEAFIVSGEPVFPDVAQDFVNYCIRKPIAMGFFDDVGKFHGVTKSGACCVEGCLAEHDYDDKSLWIWEFPKAQATYYVSVDVSQGLGGDNDYSVIWVNRVDRNASMDVHVATFRSNKIDPIDLAIIARRLGLWYNEAEIAVERTGIGASCVDHLRVSLQYPNLYRQKSDNKMTLSHKVGWETSHITKPKLVVQGIRWLKSKRWVVRDERFAHEMTTFQRDSDDSMKKMGAGKSFHDDLIMGGLICVYCAHEIDFDEDLGFIPIKQLTLESAPWKMNCFSCDYQWPAESPKEFGGCPKCGNLKVGGTSNVNPLSITAESLNKDMFEEYDWDETEEKSYDML